MSFISHINYQYIKQSKTKKIYLINLKINNIFKEEDIRQIFILFLAYFSIYFFIFFNIQ